MASAYYSVKTSQILLASILSALVSAGSIAGFMLYKERQELPSVQVDNTGKCVQVLNYKNGDAYNCNDVDVVLRTYRKNPIIDPAASAPASSPVKPDK